MIAITITGILLTIGIPGLSGALVSNRLTTFANELVAAINTARSEAVRRGQHLVIRKTGDNWENGWRLFVDIDRSTNARKNVFDSGTDIELRFFSALPSGYTLRGNHTVQNFIDYQPDGTVSTLGGSFALCESANINGARLLIIHAPGRVRIGLDTNHNGVPEKDSGVDITSCISGF